MSSFTKSRREFLKKGATVGASLPLVLSANSYASILGANDRLNVAVVGVNGRGKALLQAASLLENTRITHICDVDSRALESGLKLAQEKTGKAAKGIKDYRKLLENKNLDAVLIATPDFWHAPMAIMAARAGKHVYVEKPCSHNPHEGELLIKTQLDTNRVIQMGNQQRSARTSMEAIQMIREGVIGRAYYGKSWYANTRGPIGRGKVADVPKWLDYELWQGPVPRRPFKDNLIHYNWHWFWHYGTGETCNNATHELDICRWALDVDYPTRVTSSGGRYHYDDDWEFYDTQNVSFEYGGGKTITWEGLSCNGLSRYNRGRGAIIQGTEGSILLDRNGYIHYDKKGKVIKEVKEKVKSATTDTVGAGGLDGYHMQNFADAIRKGVQQRSPIDEGHKSVLMCHLGNIAQRMETSLRLDPTNGHILDNPAAMRLWSREYEPGWEPKTW
ncbi:MAG: Gfo/Idh/MocA family oxidoreductase [Bacteroidota bacterium]